MPYISFVAFLLIAWGAPSWRATAAIILVASGINAALMPSYMALYEKEIGEELLLKIACYADLITASCVLVFGSLGKGKQAIVLCLAAIAHYSLLTGYLSSMDMIYPAYEEIILSLSILQILIMGGAYGELSGTLDRCFGGDRGHISGRHPSWSLHYRRRHTDTKLF